MLLQGSARFTPGFPVALVMPGLCPKLPAGAGTALPVQRTAPVLSQPERHDPTGDDNLASASSPGLLKIHPVGRRHKLSVGQFPHSHCHQKARAKIEPHRNFNIELF